MNGVKKSAILTVLLTLAVSQAHAASSPRDIIWQGLMGAGVGAISSEASGGKAGKGALIGAGTQVIGNALLGILTEQPTSSNYSYTPSYYSQAPRQRTHRSYAPQPTPTVTYVPQYQVQYQPVVVRQPEPVYVQQQPVYTQTNYYPSYGTYSAPTDMNRTIIKQGLMGAGVGAIASSASGGKAWQGALIGGGTNVIGSALLELLTN